MTTSMTEPRLSTTATGALDHAFVTDLAARFEADPTARLARNAVTRAPLSDVALDRSIVTTIDHTFSHVLDQWEVTNQKQSGRCWMFAALNLLRVGAMQKMNLASFEFSQNYTLFWDKFERANWFLEAILETSAQPVDDRSVAYLLDHPVDDGGQWNMAINVIRKHGLVPKSVMPETNSSSCTRPMNQQLVHRLREGARTLRALRASGAPMEAAQVAKREILAAVHRILVVHLGAPPTEFEWQWNDKDREFHRDGRLTPQAFAEKYVTLPIDEYVCLVHDPRESSPFGRTFTVEHLGNVVGGAPVVYLNVELDVMKQIARDVIVGGEPVWFGCDVGPMMERKLGVWDRKLFDYETIYGTPYTLGKAERLEFHQSLMTHAMLFTGVDVHGDHARRWRVENSWGEDSGRKGFYVMNDSWFDEYVFEIAARRDQLPENLRAALDEEPIVLPAWDPMGALAR